LRDNVIKQTKDCTSISLYPLQLWGD